MNRHNVYFSNSRLMRLFLEHRLWAWNCALKTPLLAVFPVGSYLAGWWMLGPTLIALPLALAAGIVVPNDSGKIFIFGTMGVMLIMLPVYSQILRDFFLGCFACLTLVFGKRHLAQRLRDRAALDLAQWTKI